MEIQEGEENFDLALIASLEIDVVPHLGGPRVPDALVCQLGKILERGSKIYELEDMEFRSISNSSSTRQYGPNTPKKGKTNGTSKRSSPPLSMSPPSAVAKVYLDAHYPDLGSTDFGNLLPRERFSYWCFDLLFLICSDVTRGKL